LLKQLKLQAELKQRKSEMEALTAQKAGFSKRSEELAASLEEAKTDDDIALVQGEIEALEKEIGEADADTKITNVQGEIDRIEGELGDIEERRKGSSGKTPIKTEKRGDGKMNKYQIRELVKTGEYYERAEVKEFYEKFKNLRAVGGEGLTIPNTVINRIMDIMGDYTTLYPLVDKIRANGTTRILMDTDTTAATWVEMTDSVPTGDVGTITKIDFDGFLIGKATFVSNAMIQDSIINLDDYVTKKIARAIALGLDGAILKGLGSSNKQPEGILFKLSTSHKVEADITKLVNVVKKLTLIDTGEDSIGEIIAVMKRSTYYNRFVEFSINVDSSGNVVGKLPNLTSPDICGLRVVFSNHMDDDTVLFGDFSKYTIVERESIAIEPSEHAKFIENQTAFRGLGRFDGKPTKPDAFVAVNVDLGALQTLTVTSAAGTASGDTLITIAEDKLLGRTYQYKTATSTAPTAAYGDVLSGWTAWDGLADITATTGHKIAVCEVGTDGKVKRYGTTTVTSKA